MAKKQTRRALSISGATYDKLTDYCRANGVTMSGTTEALLKSFLDNVGNVPLKLPATPEVVDLNSQEAEIKLEREVEKARENFDLYGGRKVPELDPDTAAHRRAASIFTF